MQNTDIFAGDSKSETAIGTWICRDAMLGPDLVASSLILLLCRSTEVHERHHVREFAARLRHYLDWYPERIAQMRDNPLFIYVILYQCYNSFYTLSHQFERVYRDVVSEHLSHSVDGDLRVRRPQATRRAYTGYSADATS